jgi:hypothetical protein
MPTHYRIRVHDGEIVRVCCGYANEFTIFCSITPNRPHDPALIVNLDPTQALSDPDIRPWLLRAFTGFDVCAYEVPNLCAEADHLLKILDKSSDSERVALGIIIP